MVAPKMPPQMPEMLLKAEIVEFRKGVPGGGRGRMVVFALVKWFYSRKDAQELLSSKQER